MHIDHLLYIFENYRTVSLTETENKTNSMHDTRNAYTRKKKKTESALVHNDD